MELFAVKSKEIAAGGSSAASSSASSAAGSSLGSSLSGLAATFKDLVNRAGTQITGNLSTDAETIQLADRTGRVEPTLNSNRDDYDRRDDQGHTRGDDARETNRENGKPEGQHAERSDSDGRDHGKDQHERAATNGDARDDHQPQRDDTSRDGANSNPSESADDGSAESTNTSSSESTDTTADDSQAGSDEAGKSGGPEHNTTAGAGNAASLGAQQNANQVLAGLVVQAQGGNQQSTASPSENALKGLSTALSALDKGVVDDGGTEGTAANNTQGKQAAAGTHAAAKATVNANGNAAFNVNTDSAGEAAAASGTNAAAQAAALSKKIGEGNRLDVRVSVTDEAETLVSRPTSSLIASATQASENGNKPAQGQTNTHANPANANASAQQAAQQAAAVATGQTQQATAQAQAQSQGQGAVDAKGPAVTSLHATGGAQQAQAGGDSLTAQTPANGTTEANQAQRGTAAQNAAPQQSGTTRQAVLNQVTVQIDKALKAGIDKINIQLRPESLGRIEVRLEVTNDGRVAAIVIADNKDTLDMLQRDAKSLEQALLDAGLQADLGSMDFTLRGEQGNAQADGDGAPTGKEAEGDDDALSALLAADEGGIRADGSIDIRA